MPTRPHFVEVLAWRAYQQVCMFPDWGESARDCLDRLIGEPLRPTWLWLSKKKNVDNLIDRSCAWLQLINTIALSAELDFEHLHAQRKYHAHLVSRIQRLAGSLIESIGELGELNQELGLDPPSSLSTRAAKLDRMLQFADGRFDEVEWPNYLRSPRYGKYTTWVRWIDAEFEIVFTDPIPPMHLARLGNVALGLDDEMTVQHVLTARKVEPEPPTAT